ncbi:DUF2019 domain-containing protein [Aurantimonas sp. C2-6-R+9]|uniref:DUF2019 domain-containing protein n=1 Tax=unclassified Aurantimonas TaxID=2638230 RepID=UPI002E176D47|nr:MULTISPECIES: DUF2019 domain-containing protein [unclassified Aurantimonas]MEC5291070.1 DUF2019 domain-containing protein [Aurantimonas sp. C2-3-R2]MEC5381399.1 DUF2019 domain-containing protein [Aurantimonas sp. C2-6-R+9]MEC5412221.1 DUF2019 domain-containing protein [Aurantimonas sp. C2-4-R8]
MTIVPQLTELTVDEIVREYIAIGLAQDKAIEADDTSTFNRLARRQFAYEKELKRREGDQRRALVPLLEHSNAQIRLNAAHATLVVAPLLARETLEAVAEWESGPQALDAGMAIQMLDDGRFVPE